MTNDLARPDPPLTPALSEFTGYLLRRAFVRSAQCARGCLPDPHQIRDVVVLSTLQQRGPVSQRELADLMHVNRSIMVKLVDALQERGQLIRNRDPGDRRSYALALTENGLATLSELQQALDQAEAVLTGRLTESEHQRLTELLRQLLVGDEALAVESLATRSGYLIAQAHRRLRARASDRLRPLGIEPRHFGVLATLGEEQPCTQQHLAALLGVTPPAVLQSVDELEAIGLVQRARNAKDRRAYDLTLTESGRHSLDAACTEAAALQSEVVDLLGAAGDQDLRELLAKVLVTGVEAAH